MSASNEQTFTNGKVFSGRGEDDFAGAFTIRDGRFAWVGDSGETDTASAIDLQGRTVVPGFLDAHCHPTHVARIASAVPCTVPTVTSIPEMVAALKTHHNVGKGERAWIEGWGYDESLLAEGRPPVREDLDRVSTGQPVFVMRSDFHSAACNSRALELAGIDRDTPDPEGARIGRDEHGEPNGVLIETAARELVQRAMGPRDRQAIVDELAGVTGHYSERGIVGITDMAVRYADLAIYRDAEAKGLVQQAGLFVLWNDLVDNGIEVLDEGDRTGRTFIAGVKLFADGTVSGRTAWLGEPYPGSDDHGIAMLDEATLRAAADWARRNRVQVAVHAMGDAAIQQVIDTCADEEPWLDGVPSVRIEHASLLDEEQMRRMREARMAFGALGQVIFFYAEHASYSRNLTANQYRRAYAVRSAYDLVPHYSLSSDAPATTWADPDNVFVSIQAAVTRRAHNGAAIVVEQAVTVPQAVLLHTARAATTTPYDGRLGQIAEGFEGSFVVLDRDIFTVPADEIAGTAVAETWIAGEQVYRRPQDA
jgi:predicted amidohydrolase YtcJ